MADKRTIPLGRILRKIILIVAIGFFTFLSTAVASDHMRYEVFKNQFVTVYFPKQISHDQSAFKPSSEKAKISSRLTQFAREIPPLFLPHLATKRLSIYVIPRTQDSLLEPSGIYWCQGTLGIATSDGVFLREALLWNVADNVPAIRHVLFHEIAHVLDEDGTLPRDGTLEKMDKETFADLTALFWDELWHGKNHIRDLADYHNKISALVASMSFTEKVLNNKIGTDIVNKALAVEEPSYSPQGRKKIFLIQALPIEPEWYVGFDLLIEVMFSDGESRFYLGQKEKQAFQRLSLETDRAFVRRWLQASGVEYSENLVGMIIEARDHLAFELGVKPWLIFPLKYSLSGTGARVELVCPISTTYDHFAKLKFKYEM